MCIDLGDRYFQVGKSLPIAEKVELLLILVNNMNVFAWNPYEALKIDPKFICHRLNMDPNHPPRKQKPYTSLDIHASVVKEEVDKLNEAGAIKEVFYLEWLANTVVVKKKSGKWRVCVDFMDLNKIYPKDPFPVPKIDQLVNATFGHLRMSFLDAFQGNHQIALAPKH